MQVLGASLLVATTAVVATAQRLQPQHQIHAIPKVPLELLQRPLPLRSGIGSARDAVATESAQAQRFYDQGLAYLHSFVWIEAARSFNEALRLDPKLALAHIGLSYAYGELNLTGDSAAALAKAHALTSGLPEHDRRHIALRALQVAAETAPKDTARLMAYRSALDAALLAFPKDVELMLLRGLAESPDPAERGQGSVFSSIEFYQKALAAQPGHFGAHHYLAHAYENEGRQPEALTHSAAFAKTASAVPHARHMHGHSLRRSGRVREAIAEFETSDALQRAYFASEKVAAEYDWHYQHNLDLLGASFQYTGQMKKAEAILRTSFETPSNLVVQLFNKRQWPVFLRARGRLREALDAAKALMSHPHPLVQATGHIEAGYTLLDSGQFADAGDQYNRALRILRTNPEGAPMAGAALVGLQGELALRTAQRDKGRQILEDLARRLRDAGRSDAWVQTTFALEAAARTARAVGDWELATRLAAEMLTHDPAYAGGHYAVGLAAEYNGNAAAARAALAQALKLWSGADPDLPELAEIRKRMKP